LDRALPLLVEHANGSKHDVFTSIAALNALGALGTKAAPALAELKALPDKGPSPDGRYSSYVPRLLTDLVASLDGSARPAAKKAPAKKAKQKAE
jgi:HEAT repeat protein